MCEFCTRHGDGQIWYKNARNYALDLLSDLERRKFIEHFFQNTMGEGYNSLLRLEMLYRRKKRLPGTLVDQLVKNAKKEHFGQILPFEEIDQIVRHTSLIVRMPCACRYSATGREHRCCYGVSYSGEKWFNHLDFSYFGDLDHAGLEQVGSDEALSQMLELEKVGAIHSIWTMVTPFIGAVCNCTPEDCLALRTRSISIESLFPAEHLAAIDEEKCNGCGRCQKNCRFGAIFSRSINGKVVAVVDGRACVGCGLCRNACGQTAISMELRI
jgi:ferredoxin